MNRGDTVVVMWRAHDLLTHVFVSLAMCGDTHITATEEVARVLLTNHRA